MEGLHVLGRVVVHYHLAKGAGPQQFLAFPSRRQVGQADLTLLEAATVEAVGTVEVDGAADVVDVVGKERSTVDDQEVVRGAAGAAQPSGQGVWVQGVHVFHR